MAGNEVNLFEEFKSEAEKGEITLTGYVNSLLIE